MYVQTILDVHKKYNALVMTAFNNDAGFVAALDKVLYMIKLILKAMHIFYDSLLKRTFREVMDKIDY